jgi:predicted secreted hydrolase
MVKISNDQLEFMRRFLSTLFVLLVLFSASGCRRTSFSGSSLISLRAAPDIRGFAHADGMRKFNFPEDHGAHDGYQTEWWYYTGNLDTSSGRHFGFQLTLFRRALLPENLMPTRNSKWATNQVFMAHFALTDVDGRSYRSFERFSRGSMGLAGAQAKPFKLWLDDWEVLELAHPDYVCLNPQSVPCAYQISAEQDDIQLELELIDRKGPKLQGDQGLSRKGENKGQASYYYSLPRLEAKGTITLQGQIFQVNGWSWMDHEFSTNALHNDQIGWDWFSMQLDDGRELMVYQIRRADGNIDPFSSGTLINSDGTTTHLKQHDFQVIVAKNWTSPHSGAEYPAEWTIRIPEYQLILNLIPYLADQELNLSYDYWEGAVRIEGEYKGQVVKGNGYVELTGYSGSMGGQF